MMRRWTYEVTGKAPSRSEVVIPVARVFWTKARAERDAYLVRALALKHCERGTVITYRVFKIGQR